MGQEIKRNLESGLLAENKRILSFALAFMLFMAVAFENLRKSSLKRACDMFII